MRFLSALRLHLTHPVFNPVPPTAHSSNASAARGGTVRSGYSQTKSRPLLGYY